MCSRGRLTAASVMMELLLDIEDNDISSSNESLDVIYQKEIAENKCLPFANQLDAESAQILSQIKANLGKAVMLRELQPGCMFWTCRLNRYIDLYGMKFSKEDHVLFIKLMYELVTIPDLEISMLHEFSIVLSLLLRKKSLLSREDLELPWRPLFDTIEKISFSKKVNISMYHGYYVDSTLTTLVSQVKTYFPLSATREILDELKPKLFPLEMGKMNPTVQKLYWFLPVDLPPEHHSMGYQLWFNDFMHIWEVCHNNPTWEGDMMWLMAKLAYNNIGYINWEKHIPLMFTKFMACFKLPVAYKNQSHNSYSKISASSIGQWIVATMDKDSSVLEYFKNFATAIETYLHPANFGHWSLKLKTFLSKLSHYLIIRLNKERYRKTSWETPIPDSHKLTDEQVDEFVNCLLPLTLIAVFNKTGDEEICFTIQRLASIRPNLVIPEILDRLNSTLDSLTEPHKLVALMGCMRAVAQPMLEGSRNINTAYTFPNGPSLVLNVLFSCLPGIDPNDGRKYFTTLRLISTYVSLMSVVDTSGSQVQMDDTEREICETTSRFEDFIVQFMDRIFALIDSSTLAFVGQGGSNKSHIESFSESVLDNVLFSIFIQTSEPIFNTALHKLRTFVTENIFETKIAGQLTAIVCRVFAKINGEATLKALLPVLSESITEILDEGDVNVEESLDGRLPYAMLLLSEIMEAPGCYLLPYIDTLTNVFDKVLYLKSCETAKMANKLLMKLMFSLTNVLVKHSSKTFGYDLNDSEYPHFRNWGQGMEVGSLNVQWFIPSDKEIGVAKKLFEKYYLPEIERLNGYVEQPESFTKEDLQRSLSIVNSVIVGCKSILPIWDEEQLILKKSVVESSPITLNLGVEGEITMPDGSNVRKSLVGLMCKVQQVMFDHAEDDTKSLILLIQIWNRLLLGPLRRLDQLTIKRKTFSMLKKCFENKLVSKKKLVGPVLLERIELQQEFRRAYSYPQFTETHSTIIKELFKLSISRYAHIRSHAQVVVGYVSMHFEHSPAILLPLFLDIFNKNPDENRAAYKGALYLINGGCGEPFKQDWSALRQLLPVMVLAQSTEILSIIKLKDNIMQSICKTYKFTIIPKVPDECVSVAAKLWDTNPKPSLPMPTEEEVQVGAQQLEQLGRDNLALYNGLLEELLKALLENNLHWRQRLIAMNLILSYAHPDQKYPPRIIRYFLESLIHDSLVERKIAVQAVMYILKQNKRPHPKIEIDPKSFGALESQQSESTKPLNGIRSGVRADNHWLQYNSSTRPLTAEQWDEPRFVHSNYVGFYEWPKKLKIYAPSSQQPNLDTKTRVLTEHEAEIDRFFNNAQNIDKLMKYLSLEEKAGKDKFDSKRMHLFRGLFRNHGIAYLEHFMPHLERLVADKQESGQRCAAEVLAGLMRGCKHWPFDMTVQLWQQILPLVRTALSNLAPETLFDWSLCFVMALLKRDPNRMHWLLECLMEQQEQGKSEVSFIECGRFYIVQNAVAQLNWRCCELWRRLLVQVEDRLLANPFQNLRDRLASLLFTIFNVAINFDDEKVNSNGAFELPNPKYLVDKVAPTFQQLVDHFEMDGRSDEKALSSQIAGVHLTNKEKTARDIDSLKSQEPSIRLFKTICEWIKHCTVRSFVGPSPDFYKLHPVICQFENFDADNELAKVCSTTLAVLSQAIMLPRDIPVVLQSVKKVSKFSSWSTRMNVLVFLQTFVFHNMGSILSNKEHTDFATDIVIELLQDERLEVREEAASVLGGFLHCSIISDQEKLLTEMRKKAKTKVPKRKRTYGAASNTSQSNLEREEEVNAIRLRHAGVLGLCSFISSHPYDVPKYVPTIFENLSMHLNDPQPIPATIRKTLLNFKRTHYDNWSSHAQQFTEEQLTVLADLTVPPSHYT